MDITSDVTAVLVKFQNVGGPEKARSDMEPSNVDFLINISDVTFVLNAFSGETYPFEPPGSVPCLAN